MRILRENDAQSAYGAAVGRLLNEVEIGNRASASTALFKPPTWRELGFPETLWRASFYFRPGLTSEDALERPWQAWRETVADLGTTEIITAMVPLHIGVPDRVSATICELTWESINAAGRAVDIFAWDEWLAFDQSESWAMRCHWEGIAILGASPEWVQRFLARYGSQQALKAEFEAKVDGEFMSGPMPEAIKASVRWPDG